MTCPSLHVVSVLPVTINMLTFCVLKVQLQQACLLQCHNCCCVLTLLLLQELWSMLHSASSNESGIPQQLLEAKQQELKERREREAAIQVTQNHTSCITKQLGSCYIWLLVQVDQQLWTVVRSSRPCCWHARLNMSALEPAGGCFVLCCVVWLMVVLLPYKQAWCNVCACRRAWLQQEPRQSGQQWRQTLQQPAWPVALAASSQPAAAGLTSRGPQPQQQQLRPLQLQPRLSPTSLHLQMLLLLQDQQRLRTARKVPDDGTGTAQLQLQVLVVGVAHRRRLALLLLRAQEAQMLLLQQAEAA